MTPGSYALIIYRGDTYQWRFTLWADHARTEPLDLTGAVAAAEIRDKSGGTVIVLLDCTITDPNIVEVTLDAVNSARCPLKGVWDLQITYPGEIVRTVVAGAVTAIADVTDSTPTIATAASKLLRPA